MKIMQELFITLQSTKSKSLTSLSELTSGDGRSKNFHWSQGKLCILLIIQTLISMNKIKTIRDISISRQRIAHFLDNRNVFSLIEVNSCFMRKKLNRWLPCRTFHSAIKAKAYCVMATRKAAGLCVSFVSWVKMMLCSLVQGFEGL